MSTTKPLATLFFSDKHQWYEWLHQNFAQENGVWLKFAKKTSGITSITYDEALDIALCFGWIDGQSASLDEKYYLQKFTPRRAKSMWSRRNVAKVEKLLQEGKMQQSGMAAVEAAKQDGRWEQAYDSPKNIQIPPDFQDALQQNPEAEAFFATLTKTDRYAFLWRIQTAKKLATRQARIEKCIEMLNAGLTFYSPRRK